MSRSKPGKGLTNKQAAYLASLQRQAGERYTGAGLTRQQAMLEINRLTSALGRAPAPVKRGQSPRAAAVERAPKASARRAAARVKHQAIAESAPPPRAGRDAPTPAQLHDLAVLARRAGEATPQPPTRGDAARELARLRSASP